MLTQRHNSTPSYDIKERTLKLNVPPILRLCVDFLQALMAQRHHAAAIIVAALLNVVLIDFQLGHGHGEEIIAYPVKDVAFAKDDQLMEALFAFSVSPRAAKARP